MSGYKLTLPTRFDADLPVLRLDPVLNKGSLLLVEPAHPASTYQGNLADGDRLDNLAWKEAQKLVGGTEETLKARYENQSPGKVYWTDKKSIQWWAGSGTGRNGAHFPMPILAYLKANPKHVYRAIMWSGLVQWGEAPGTQAVSGRWSNVNFDLADGLNSTYYDMTGGAGGNVDINGVTSNNDNKAAGPRRSSQGSGSNGYTGPNDATIEQADVWSRIFGNINSNRGPGGGQGIFHRFYLEDLTVSGRTADDLEALDKTLYIKHVLKEGGRHFGTKYVRKD